MDIKVKADELLESGEAYLKICKEIEDTITKVYDGLDHVFGEGSWQGFSKLFVSFFPAFICAN